MLLVGWIHGMLTNQNSVSVLWSTLGVTRYSYNEHFRLLNLSEEEIKSDSRFLLDTWADTICSGKHAYMEEFIEHKMVPDTGFQ